MRIINRYTRKLPKVDASIFDSALSHTRRSDASEKEKKIACQLFDIFACGQVSSPRLYRSRFLISIKNIKKQLLQNNFENTDEAVFRIIVEFILRFVFWGFKKVRSEYPENSVPMSTLLTNIRNHKYSFLI